MDAGSITRRNMIGSLLGMGSAVILPGWLAGAVRGNVGQPERENDPRQLAPSAMRRLSNPRGRVEACGFSPDRGRLCVGVAAPESSGLSLFLLDVTDRGDPDDASLLSLPQARRMFSIAWEPDGAQRLALAVWEHDLRLVKPYRLMIYVVEPDSGRIAAEVVALEYRTPTDTGGKRVEIAWLGNEGWLAAVEGRGELLRFGLNAPKPATVCTLEDAGVGTGNAGYWRTPVSLTGGRASVVMYHQPATAAGPVTRLIPVCFVFDGSGRRLVRRALGSVAPGPTTILCAPPACFRSMAKDRDLTGFVDEVVHLSDGVVIARLPETSPFAADGSDLTRTPLAITADGSRAAWLEVDHWPATAAGQPGVALRPEPFGRLVAAEFPVDSS